MAVYIPTRIHTDALATFNAFLPLAKILQWFLLLPIQFTTLTQNSIHPVDDVADKSEDHSAKFKTTTSCLSKSFHVMLSTGSAFVILPVSTWYLISDYSARLKAPREKYFTTIYLMLESFCVVTICFCAIIPSRRIAFQHLFSCWRAIDRTLGIHEDLELGQCARRLIHRWILTNAIGFIMVLTLAVFKILDTKIYPERAKEVSSPFIIGPLIVCVLYLTAALCGTEVLLYFHCKAALLRMRCIRQRVAVIVKQSNVRTMSYTESSLECCRLSLEALRSISAQTAELMSPLFLSSTIACGSTLSCSVVGLLHQESGNVGFTMLKSCLGLFSFCNVVLLVRAATLQNREAKMLLCTLQSASTVYMDRPSQFQLYLMTTNVKYLPLEFTACGFFSLNYKFLQAMIGVVLTCLLTAVDFEKDSPAESHTGARNCTN